MKKRFQAGMSVGLILIKDNQILLLRRFNTGYADGQYGLPSGCVEENESLTQAIIREAKEEAGIILKHEWLQFGCVLYCNKELEEKRDMVCNDYFFIAHQWEGEIKNMEPHKCDQLQFFDLNNLPDNIIPRVKAGIAHALDGKPFVEYQW